VLQLIPNVITSLRLLLAIPICIFIYQGNELLALLLFIFAGISDGFDGYLARRFTWESEFGKLLDPLADKCLILSTLLALAYVQLLPIWLVSILLVRDALAVMGSMLYLMLFEGRNSESNRWGKHFTGWTIALFIITLLQESISAYSMLLNLLYEIAVVGVLIFTALSVFTYARKQGKEVYKHLFRS
jgi:cardiolipin synthase